MTLVNSGPAPAVLLGVAMVAFSIYLGGAVAMELILRFAQEDLPGPQTAITCKVAGDRWKWIALTSLSVTGISVVAVVLLRSELLPESYSWAYGGALAGFAAAWVTLMSILVRMSMRAHPALAYRPDPSMPPDEFAETRQALKRAIRRMDHLLRTELGIAVFMAACLSVITGLAE